MTNSERKNFASNRLAKYEREGQRRVLIQHAHSARFGDGTNKQMQLATDAGSGWLPREGVDNDPNDVSNDITTASSYVEMAIANTSDVGLADGLRAVLATLNALSKAPNGSLVPKGKVNVGTTEDTRFVPSNKASSTGGSDRWVNVADLSDSPALMRLLKKYPKVAEEFAAK